MEDYIEELTEIEILLNDLSDDSIEWGDDFSEL